MSLRDVDEKGAIREVAKLDHEQEFNRQYTLIPTPLRTAMEDEINRRLDHLLSSPSPNWGSITNTSIEGGKANPITGVRGDWTGTVFEAIYTMACGQSERQSAMLYGNLWKKVIIERSEPWVGVRFDPTFSNRGITLQGKSYFPDRNRRS